jgi:hypothetical protein
MGNPKALLTIAIGKMNTDEKSDEEMDEECTPEELLQDIKDDLDLLVKKLKGK